MANRLDTYKALAATYLGEIEGLAKALTENRTAIEQLKLDLAIAENKERQFVETRAETVEQYRAVMTLVHGMEDTLTARIRSEVLNNVP